MEILQQLVDFILGFVDMIRNLVKEVRSRNDEK